MPIGQGEHTMFREESRSLWPVKKDLEADALPEIERLFRRFETDYGFSRDEVFHRLEEKKFLEKVFLIHEKFRFLIEEYETRVKEINPFHKNHRISFSETDSPDILSMKIHAECVELPLLIRILQLILKTFDNEKATLLRKSLGISAIDFEIALKRREAIRANRKKIQTTIREMVNQSCRGIKNGEVTINVKHKNGIYFAILRMKNFKIELRHQDVACLAQEITRTMPLFIKIMKGATKKVRKKKK